MKILLLPGASDSNKEWEDTWAGALSNEGHEVFKIYYEHWGKQDMFDFQKEADKLSNLDASWKGCVVVAKSIGTLLTIFAVHKKLIFPKKAIFMGFPVRLDGEKDAKIKINLKEWSRDYVVQTNVFQNEHDPVTSFQEVGNFVSSFHTFYAEKIPGDTHKYLPDACLGLVLDKITGK